MKKELFGPNSQTEGTNIKGTCLALSKSNHDENEPTLSYVLEKDVENEETNQEN